MVPLTPILTASCLVSAFITFGLGITAYVRNPRSEVNCLFLLSMLSVTYWALGEFFIWFTPSLESVWFWLKFSSFWPLVIAFTLHFVLALTNPPAFRNNRVLYLTIIYLPSLVISCILLFTDWIMTVAYEQGVGYTYLPVRSSPAYQAECLYILLMMLYAFWVIFTFWHSARERKIKNQARLVGFAIATVIIFGFLSGILLPAFAIYTPNLVFIGIVIFSVLITIAMQKHELFVLSPITAVPDILRTMPDAMILSDLQGTVVSVNDSAGRILGIDGKTLPGKSIRACIPDEAYTKIQEAMAGPGFITDIETSPLGTGSRAVSIAGSRVQDPDGEPAGMVLILRDITDRKNAETALRIANEKIALLTGITRHDINNLISALSGYLLLIRENPDDPETSSHIAASMQIVERIQNKLRFTRDYQDIGSCEPVWQSLELIMFHAICDLSHPDTAIDSSLEKVEIYTDPLIVKVISNILDNAIRHGNHVTRIRISTLRQDDESLLIMIEDNGTGIREEDKERIFHYRYVKNSGVGLALSRDIVSLTGITIAETGTPGAGARFAITVPPRAWRPLL